MFNRLGFIFQQCLWNNDKLFIYDIWFNDIQKWYILNTLNKSLYKFNSTYHWIPYKADCIRSTKFHFTMTLCIWMTNLRKMLQSWPIWKVTLTVGIHTRTETNVRKHNNYVKNTNRKFIYHTLKLSNLNIQIDELKYLIYCSSDPVRHCMLHNATQIIHQIYLDFCIV